MTDAPFAALLEEYPWLTAFADQLRRCCPDCACALRERHADGCDIARCSACGGQRLACGCVAGGDDVWRGLMYFEEHRHCLEHDLWCRTSYRDAGGRLVFATDATSWLAAIGVSDGSMHVPCGRGDAGAYADINRATMALAAVRSGRTAGNQAPNGGKAS